MLPRKKTQGGIFCFGLLTNFYALFLKSMWYIHFLKLTLYPVLFEGAVTIKASLLLKSHATVLTTTNRCAYLEIKKYMFLLCTVKNRLYIMGTTFNSVMYDVGQVTAWLII
jgi:hypothetical protein